MEKNHSSSVENMIEFATKELNNYSFIDAGCGNGWEVVFYARGVYPIQTSVFSHQCLPVSSKWFSSVQLGAPFSETDQYSSAQFSWVPHSDSQSVQINSFSSVGCPIQSLSKLSAVQFRRVPHSVNQSVQISSAQLSLVQASAVRFSLVQF